MLRIEKIENGYLLHGIGVLNKTKCFKTLEELFQEVLFTLEGKSELFTGNSYGKVIIELND